MATENGPCEDVSPIKNGDFNCHVSSPEGTCFFLNFASLTERGFASCEVYVSMCIHTVDGRNPKQPVDMVNIPLSTRFHIGVA